MEHHQEKKNLPPFHPVFEGCVVRDPCMANAVGESYLEELYAIVSYNYRTTIARGCNKPLAELFDRIAKLAGAGTLVPITGFANSVVSPAIDSHAEGLVLGVGAKIFTVAGPVLLYGTLAGSIYGVIYWIVSLF